MYTKKKKDYYSGHQNKKSFSKREFLDAGMQGFLCTCNFYEKECVRDAYKILNEYLKDKQVLGKEQDTNTKEVTNELDKHEEKPDDLKQNYVDDVSASLKKEISELKSQTYRTFQAVDTGIKNTIFIKTTSPETLKLAESIIKDAFETKNQKTRFIMRLLPVEVVCKAYLDNIKTKADPLFDNYFVKEPKTFAIAFTRRSNSNIQRNEVIDALAELVTKKNPENKVNLDSAELTVVVEIIRNFCLLSVVPNYILYKKYNLAELYGSDLTQKVPQNSLESKSDPSSNVDKQVEKDEGKQDNCVKDNTVVENDNLLTDKNE